MKIRKLFHKLKEPGKIALGLFAFLTLIQNSYAIGITPVRTELNLSPGESSEVTLTVINKSDTDIQAIPDIEAFLQNDEQGFPIPLELTESDIHNVTNWIKIPTDPIDLPAHGSAEVTFSVEVPSAAEPGGKYVLIAYKPVKKAEGQVTVVSRVATLVLINVKGEVILKGDVNSFSIPEPVKSDQPFYFSVNFENTGNTHIKPQGWIEIIDRESGKNLKEIAEYTDPETGLPVLSDRIPVNLNGGNVLPNSKRIFKSEWNKNLATGSYKAALSLEYGEKEEILDEIDFELKEDLKTENFDINLSEKDASFSLTLSNRGNIHEKLQGLIEITNEFGYKLAEVMIPENIEYLIPGETKTFTFNWLNKEIPKGRYTATLKAKSGISGSDFTAEVNFGRTDPVKYLLGGGIVILLILIFILIIRKRRNSGTKP